MNSIPKINKKKFSRKKHLSICNNFKGQLGKKRKYLSERREWTALIKKTSEIKPCYNFLFV